MAAPWQLGMGSFRSGLRLAPPAPTLQPQPSVNHSGERVPLRILAATSARARETPEAQEHLPQA